jgi:hypothetical protein
MGAPLYSGITGGATGLTAATARTVIGAKAHANSGLMLEKLKVGFDGITSNAIPVLVEVCYCTFGTNPPGTSSTSVTVAQKSGRPLTAGFTMGKNWTAGNEPTTITVFDECLIPAFMGVLWYDIPLGDEYDTALGEGFAVRFTAPAAVNVRATMDLRRC